MNKTKETPVKSTGSLAVKNRWVSSGRSPSSLQGITTSIVLMFRIGQRKAEVDKRKFLHLDVRPPIEE